MKDDEYRVFSSQSLESTYDYVLLLYVCGLKTFYFRIAFLILIVIFVYNSLVLC